MCIFSFQAAILFSTFSGRLRDPRVYPDHFQAGIIQNLWNKSETFPENLQKIRSTQSKVNTFWGTTALFWNASCVSQLGRFDYIWVLNTSLIKDEEILGRDENWTRFQGHLWPWIFSLNSIFLTPEIFQVRIMCHQDNSF